MGLKQGSYLQACGHVSTLTDTTTRTLTGRGSISHFMCLSACWIKADRIYKSCSGGNECTVECRLKKWACTCIWSMESMMMMMFP